MPSVTCSIERDFNRTNILALTGLSKHFLELESIVFGPL